MGEIINWLIHDDQKELFEILVALVLNIIFLALNTLLLWPLDRLMLALGLAKGYGVLWLAICLTAVLLNHIQRFFRVNLYEHFNAYMLSNLVVSCFLQMGWSAFAALTVNNFVTGVPIWMALILYLAGFLSCLIAFFAVSSFYQGTIYKLVSLPLALAGFLVFSVWPAACSMAGSFNFFEKQIAI
jgi:hypothetical protein